MNYKNSSIGNFYSYPIDINIRISSFNSKYEADVRVSGMRPQRFRIELTINDVQDINLGLQRAIEQVALNCRHHDNCMRSIQQLASAGKSAFNRIFRDGLPRETILKALNSVHLKEGPTIEIESEQFFIPWELLYHASLNEEVNPMNFWGMHFVISRIILQDSRPGDMVSPIIESVRPQVGLLAYSKLRHVADKEIPLLQGLHDQDKILLYSLRRLKINQRQEDLKYLGDFLSDKELQIVHLACHADERSPMSESFLILSDKFPISIQEFAAREFKGKYNPIVILNACRTGTISSLYSFSWAALFWEYGARGVLATEFRVPDWFAATFVEELYKYLLSEIPIGDSLWLSRRYFWKEKNNPLGLAYALYSPLAVRIVNSKVSPKDITYNVPRKLDKGK